MGYRVQAELRAIIKRLQDRLDTDESLTSEDREEIERDIANLTQRLDGE